jgi:hypothetical protein
MAMALTKCGYEVDPEVRITITFPERVPTLSENLEPYNYLY